MSKRIVAYVSSLGGRSVGNFDAQETPEGNRTHMRALLRKPQRHPSERLTCAYVCLNPWPQLIVSQNKGTPI